MPEDEPINGGFNAYDEELARDAVIATVAGASAEEKSESWQMRRRAHVIARDMATDAGLDMYEKLFFVGGVRKLVSHPNIVQMVSGYLEEAKSNG